MKSGTTKTESTNKNTNKNSDRSQRIYRSINRSHRVVSEIFFQLPTSTKEDFVSLVSKLHNGDVSNYQNYEVIQAFKHMVESDIVSSDRFSFVAIGYNLSFEHKFFSHRCAANSLYPIDIITRPHIDLHPIAIMINSGDFKETTLSAFTNKKRNGTQIPIWYDQKNYSDIENYISEEFAEFSPPEKSEEKTVNINWTTVSVIGTLGGITFAAFKIFKKLKKDALE